MSDGVAICYTLCWPCKFDSHYADPTWHTWADGEDIEHAANTGQPDPSTSPCACEVCGTPPTEQQRTADVAAARSSVGAAGTGDTTP